MGRIKLSWAVFGKLRDILENEKLAQHQKTKLIRYVVLPVMTYQTRAMTKRNMDRLIRIQKSLERRMLHIIKGEKAQHLDKSKN